jgi:hypothetical protein
MSAAEFRASPYLTRNLRGMSQSSQIRMDVSIVISDPYGGLDQAAEARRRRSLMDCHSALSGTASTTMNCAPSSSHRCNSA